MKHKLGMFFLFFIGCVSFTFGWEGGDTLVYKQAEYYHQKMVTLARNGETVVAKEYIDSLIEYSQENGLDEYELKALMNLAIIHNRSKKHSEALSLYLDIIERSEHIPNVDKVAIMARVNLGNTYNSIGEYKKAIDCFKQSLTDIEGMENNDFIKSAIYSGMIRAYSLLENYEKSLQYGLQLKAIAVESKNTYVLVQTLAGISRNYYRLEDYNNALIYAKKAEVINRNYERKKLSDDWVYLNIGMAYYKLNQNDSSKFYLLKSRAIALDKSNKDIECTSEEYLAKVYDELGDYKNAQKSLNRYAELKVLDAEEAKKTAVLDVKKETDQLLKSSRNNSIIVILIVLAIGVVVIVYFRSKRQKELKENHQLQRDFKWLQKEYGSLKISFENLSKSKEVKKGKAAKYNNSRLKEEDRKVIMKRLLNYMEQEKPYLDAELTQLGLAKCIDVEPYHLSEVLTLSLEQNFYNFINFYRVNHAQLLLEDKKYQEYTLEGIGYESGFKNRSSFNRVFKNISGDTPSSYRKKVS